MPDMNLTQVDDDAVLKEVWNKADIEAKTELTVAQIERVNKLHILAQMFHASVVTDLLENFMVLQKSKDRKSMEEFVNVVRAKRDDFVNQGKGFFSSMFG